jgi:hypothetical protein
MSSTDPKVIVEQLLTILDEIDSYENAFELDYYININTYCHMALAHQSNETLLPFVNLIQRYKHRDDGHKARLFQSCYNKCQQQLRCGNS